MFVRCRGHRLGALCASGRSVALFMWCQGPVREIRFLTHCSGILCAPENVCKMGEKEEGPSDQARVCVFSCTWALVASSLVRREGIDGSTLRDDIPLPNHITFCCYLRAPGANSTVLVEDEATARIHRRRAFCSNMNMPMCRIYHKISLDFIRHNDILYRAVDPTRCLI